ncbi:hypothetical protein [Microvirga thermotolerans]|uniref:Uncharacterized protein n=1 Tax=Microvirga thermotolerans TaxID=2651334 RepID=A0A5P9JX78_9HYPH|nr:hypothetical protein [Microvirga thermotolerans]QFU17197.1 hypothetical protein GDR74_13745 [Microvirga thermotolerans]
MTLSPIVLPLFALLVAGWSVALAASFPARRREALRDALSAALLDDPRFGEADRAAVRDGLASLLGPGMGPALLAGVPAILLALALQGLAARIRGVSGPSPLERLEWARHRAHELRRFAERAEGGGAVREDPRFRRLEELAFECELLRRPFLMLGLGGLSLPALALYGLAYGFREAFFVLPQLAFFLAKALAPVLRPPVRRRRPTSGTGRAR